MELVSGCQVGAGQCYIYKSQGALAWQGRRVGGIQAEPWVRWNGTLDRKGGFLTFAEQSSAGSSLGLTQAQHLGNHLCQTPGQLGARGEGSEGS